MNEMHMNNITHTSILSRLGGDGASWAAAALSDPLTGVYSGPHLLGELARELRRAARRRSRLGVIALDIDGLKGINESHGRDAGDAVLKALAALLARSVRAEDLISREGGDEFLLVMPDAAPDVVAARAEKLRSRVETLDRWDGHERHVTVSVGVAAYPDHGDTPEALVAEAGHALRLAKAGGCNQVVVAPRGLDYRAMLRNGVAKPFDFATPANRSVDTPGQAI
jgi:diguanylate cyclase (GGDEF)-like protein